MQIQEEKETFCRLRWELKAKGQPHPAKRWCHTATIHGSHLYVMGGRVGESAKTKQLSYRINCQTYLCQQIQIQDNPMMRQSHSCSLIKDSLYVLFGVSKSSKVLNDCIQFKITPNTLLWQKKQQKPQIISRESHMSLVLDGKYIFIYGGTDSDQKLIQDFHLYDVERQSWTKIQKITGAVQVKVGGTLINIKNQIYLFGGQINDQNQYSNQIYKIQLKNYRENDKEHQPQISILKLNINGVKPLPRSQFASVSFKDRYLIVLGGQGAIKEKNQFPTLLGDIWSFDTQKLLWEEMIPENQNFFKPRSSFTATVYKQSLIVFGGLIAFKDFKSTDQILVLNLNNQVQKKPICNLCRASFKAVQKQQVQMQKTQVNLNTRHFQTGFSTIFAVSQTIQQPFTALSTLLHSFDPFQIQQCSFILSQQKLAINLKKISISDAEWRSIISSYEFAPLIQQSDKRVLGALKSQIRHNSVNYLSYNLKNSSFRLGKQFLISWINSQNQLQIYLMNKFGIYSTSNINQQTTSYPSHASVILQFLKQYDISITRLFQNSMSIYVTSLNSQNYVNGRNQLCYDACVGDIVWKNNLTFKQYLARAFSKNLSFRLAVSSQQVSFMQSQKFVQTRLNSVKQAGQQYIDRWPQQNNHPDIFQSIYTYEEKGKSTILVYQNNKLMHRKQMQRSQGTVYQFHVTSKIQPNLTFSDVIPTEKLLNAIKTAIIGINSPTLTPMKRENSLERQQIKQGQTNSPQKNNSQQQPSKAVKTNQTQNCENSIEM